MLRQEAVPSRGRDEHEGGEAMETVPLGRADLTVSQLANAWALDNPAVDTAIVGSVGGPWPEARP
jgi:aryl-alcohol dehydrogenase-like predicted oxidoreductase